MAQHPTDGADDGAFEEELEVAAEPFAQGMAPRASWDDQVANPSLLPPLGPLDVRAAMRPTTAARSTKTQSPAAMTMRPPGAGGQNAEVAQLSDALLRTIGGPARPSLAPHVIARPASSTGPSVSVDASESASSQRQVGRARVASGLNGKDDGDSRRVTDTSTVGPLPVATSPLDTSPSPTGPSFVEGPRAAPAALEQLEALLYDPATSVVLDGRAAVVSLDGLRVRVVADANGLASVSVVAADAALGEALSADAVNLATSLERAGLSLTELRVERSERGERGFAESGDDRRRPPEVDEQGPRRRRTASPATSTTHPLDGVGVRA